ncbi:hypothetical protein [uncultured Pseudoteredinibacter sp.]|uniref:hypothetical protein n=1 Tax=uncultured Pseudoteredinibacter sp. TaxID=1641701 RepID=UPI00261484BC|nr:hypothetical protein [uncultured Pseudoteredinibacter sp.]
MSDILLFVFEGEVTESKVLSSFRRFFIESNSCTIIEAAYKTNIYSLYSQLRDDPDLDIGAYLIERMGKSNSIDREKISEVHLFFDLDSHDPSYSCERVEAILSYFDNETENGKIHISYPMVEAIKHVNNNSDFNNTITDVTLGKGYKSLVHNETEVKYRNVAGLSETDWKHLTRIHCSKANHLVNQKGEFPHKVITQEEIYSAQKAQHLNKKVAALSAFPLMALNYYGANKLDSMTG